MIKRDARLPLWHHLNSDNFGFMLFLATAVHGVLLLALSFTLPEPKPPQHTLDVTLAQHPQKEAPEQADFIAQHNQVGSGTEEAVSTPTTTEEAPLASDSPKLQAAREAPSLETSVDKPPAPVPLPGKAEQPKAETGKEPAPEQLVTQAPKPKPKPQPRQEQAGASMPTSQTRSSSLLSRSLEMASLQAQVDLQRETRARKPRVLRLTSAATRKHEYASYLDNWRRRVETVGNLNYPEQARSRGIQGRLRMLVALDASGKVVNVDILSSSGHAVLDDAAIRIVQLASPFQSFPVEMRKKVDRLEIIRTWKFEKHARVY
ncbi:energy transducer TonB [Marinobacterium stanieri]|uniref:energy transducer TonB n=1 Tax=Marinobacterium stanieri TaxID=49186 RepID=UPI003A91C109